MRADDELHQRTEAPNGGGTQDVQPREGRLQAAAQGRGATGGAAWWRLMEPASLGARKSYLETSTRYPVPRKTWSKFLSLPSSRRTLTRAPFDVADTTVRPRCIGTSLRRCTSHRA